MGCFRPARHRAKVKALEEETASLVNLFTKDGVGGSVGKTAYGPKTAHKFLMGRKRPITPGTISTCVLRGESKNGHRALHM